MQDTVLLTVISKSQKISRCLYTKDSSEFWCRGQDAVDNCVGTKKDVMVRIVWN